MHTKPIARRLFPASVAILGSGGLFAQSVEEKVTEIRRVRYNAIEGPDSSPRHRTRRVPIRNVPANSSNTDCVRWVSTIQAVPSVFSRHEEINGE